jgi:hypothetical protein
MGGRGAAGPGPLRVNFRLSRKLMNWWLSRRCCCRLSWSGRDITLGAVTGDETGNNAVRSQERGNTSAASRRAVLKGLTARERDLLRLTLENHPQLSVSDALRALRAGGM